MSPRVSVVLTTFNRADILPATIDTLLRQTYRDFELVISDDASSDNTREVCERYATRDSRVRYLRQQCNLGMPGNLNAGIAQSCGELIANVHDGDVYPDDLLEKWVEALDRCRDATFVFNGYVSLDGTDAGDRWLLPLERCNAGRDVLRVFYRRWRFDSPVWGTTMVRRSAYERAGIFQERFGFSSDVAMWMRLAELGSVAYCPNVLIGLPSREILPRLVSSGGSGMWRDRALLRRMYWESRLRSIRQGIVSPGEFVCHIAFTLASEGMICLLRLRRWILNMPWQRLSSYRRTSR